MTIARHPLLVFNTSNKHKTQKNTLWLHIKELSYHFLSCSWHLKISHCFFLITSKALQIVFYVKILEWSCSFWWLCLSGYPCCLNSFLLMYPWCVICLCCSNQLRCLCSSVVTFCPARNIVSEILHQIKVLTIIKGISSAEFLTLTMIN